MADLSATVDTDGTGDYTSLNAGEAAEQQDLTDGGGDTFTFTCEASSGSADTSSVVFLGWTTASASPITTEAAATDVAVKTGIDSARYRLLITDTTAIDVREDFVRFDALQVKLTAIAGSRHCIAHISINATNLQRVSNCYLEGDDDGTFNSVGIRSSDSSTILQVFNTITTKMGNPSINSAGIYFSGTTADIFNSITHGGSRGVRRTAGTVTCENVASFNNDVDFAGTITVNFCASDDNTGTNNVAETGGGADWTGDFVDAANGDFTLLTGSGLKDNGTDDPGSGLFSTDIDGDAYVSTWSVGVDEFVGGITFDVSASDGFAMGDTPSAALTMSVSASDGLKAGDTPGGSLTIPVVGTDGVVLSDDPAAALQLAAAVADGMKLSDTPSSQITFGVTVTDGIKFSDTVSAAIQFVVSVTDGIVFSDVASTAAFLPGGVIAVTISTDKASVTVTALAADVGISSDDIDVEIV